jgi:hypothetical protein
MRLSFHHTHAYPGCRVTIADENDDSVRIEAEFSDGALPGVSVDRLGADELSVEIDAYRTARGTAIPAKRWILRRIAGDSWKVARRATARR